MHGECTVNHGDLVQFAQTVFRASRDSVHETQSQTLQNDSADRALALIQFDKLMAERAVSPHYQPIVTMDGQLIGYEILGRSRLFSECKKTGQADHQDQCRSTRLDCHRTQRKRGFFVFHESTEKWEAVILN